MIRQIRRNIAKRTRQSWYRIQLEKFKDIRTCGIHGYSGELKRNRKRRKRG